MLYICYINVMLFDRLREKERERGCRRGECVCQLKEDWSTITFVHWLRIRMRNMLASRAANKCMLHKDYFDVSTKRCMQNAKTSSGKAGKGVKGGESSDNDCRNIAAKCFSIC